ncbi:MAG: hypothetical protein FWD87_10435 [Spirochaetaceae bacterium]|nr:hypothetical protein [Spirochaetaceae bacterium]
MEAITKYIDDLLIEHRVTLKMVYDCSVNEKKTIAGIKKIFDLKKQNDFLLSMVALRILSGNNTEKIHKYFQEDCDMYYDLDDKFFEENKTLILTAFIYNPRFFAMAVNMRGLIAYELQKQKKHGEKKVTKKTLNVKEKIYGGVFSVPAFQLDYLAASSDEPGLIEIMKRKKLDLNGIRGELSVYGNKQDRTILFSFEFEKAHTRCPFYLDIKYITRTDKKTHKVSLNKKLKKIGIESQMQYNIDFSKGITITEIKGVKID